MNKDTNWMAIGEAAKYLGVSRDTLRRWERRGRIKAVRSPTNRRYYTKRQLNEVMAGKKVEISPPKKKPTRRKAPVLVIAAILSFILAALLALLIQFFLLSP